MFGILLLCLCESTLLPSRASLMLLLPASDSSGLLGPVEVWILCSPSATNCRDEWSSFIHGMIVVSFSALRASVIVSISKLCFSSLSVSMITLIFCSNSIVGCNWTVTAEEVTCFSEDVIDEWKDWFKLEGA